MMAYVSGLSSGDSRFLADLFPAIGAHLGLPGFGPDNIGLPDSRRYVVVLVDGLGWDLAITAGRQAPYLAGLIGDAARVSTGLPTTTAASLTSLWTGVMPGRHGIVGFSFAVGGRRRGGKWVRHLVRPLSVERPILTAPSLLDQMVRGGIEVSCVVPPEHLNSGLTMMSSGLARMAGVEAGREQARVAEVAAAARRGERSLVYVYDARLDQAGHRKGVASQAWSLTLRQIDGFLENLRAGLDDDVCLLVTGDHGMIDVAEDDRIDIDKEPDLCAEVNLVGGEARFRHLYTGAPGSVRDRWQARFGEQAAVLTREEAVEAGWFGEVDPAYLGRIGDVVAMPVAGLAFLSPGFPGEYLLVGMHGADTAAERYVPVLMD